MKNATHSSSIIFDNVTIEYNIYNTRSFSLRNKLVESVTGGFIRRGINTSVVTAVKNASFSLKTGDRVGIVGGNGAGKTTLLRAMAGIYPPIKGKVQITGSVATIIDIGAGMDEELSGIQNIYRLALLRGVKLADIEDKIGDIEEFSGLGAYLKLPIRTYSSGMKIRLMFAVATMTNPDILLIDEMFSTGDADFQIKATARIENNIEKSQVFIFASHDLSLVKKYCHRIFQMAHGFITEIASKDLK
jgi:lipopolysaccharide transport system ATP-binding protein